MKRKRNLALIVLMAAVVCLLIVGFYRSVTHQQTLPADNVGPGAVP